MHQHHFTSCSKENSQAPQEAKQQKGKHEVVIKFPVLFKILVLILKKEVHFLGFSFRVRLYPCLFICFFLFFFLLFISFFFFNPVFSILHKRPETTGLSKSCRQRRSEVAPDGDHVAPMQCYPRVLPKIRWIGFVSKRGEGEKKNKEGKNPKREREPDRGDRKNWSITRVSAAYIMYMLGIKSVNTFKTLKFPKAKMKGKKKFYLLFFLL